MQIVKPNGRPMPLRRVSSDSSFRYGSFPGKRRFTKRFYYGMLLLVVYTAFLALHFSIGRGLKQFLTEEHSMNLKPSSYISQQLEALERPTHSYGAISNQESKTSLVDAQEENKHAETNGAPISLPEDHQQQPAKSNKPRLILHVGPQETGSATIRSMLDILSRLTGSLEVVGDNFLYRHITPKEGDFDCVLDKYGGWHKCVASESLQALIATAKRQGKNLLLTDENLDQNFAQGLRDAIHDEDWDVTVIVMYRRIHEWLVSWYHQIQKTTNLDSEGKILFDQNGIPYRTDHVKWPDQGGVHIPSFPSWYQEYTRYWEPAELVGKHRSIEYYNLYKESFSNVLLYNMHHQEGSMTEDFFCNVLQAANSCLKIRNQQAHVERVDESVNLDLDILSVYAYERGLIPKWMRRKVAVELVESHVKETGKALPRNCDSGMNHQIRDWLIATEKIMVGESNWSDDLEANLLKLYSDFVATGKMCNVDVDAVLADDEWIRFFQSLSQYKKGNLVLHVGPFGGTDIYNALTYQQNLHRALQDDKYTLVEISSPDKIQSIVSSFERTGKNILIANDDLDERFAEAFQKGVDQDKWNVKVIIGYVRLNESLLSMYQHLYGSEATIEPNQEELYSKWLDQGGAPKPTFHEWFHTLAVDSKDLNVEELLGGHLRKAYASTFGDVEYSAYHPQQETMVTNFVCQILPRAPNTCKVAKEDQTLSSSSQSEFEFLLDAEVDSLALAAHEKGMVGKGISRETVRTAIHTKLSEGQMELSRICVSSETKQFYDWMVESEKTMMGDRFTSKRIAWINQEFQSLLESGNLCALDFETLLSDDAWVRFFRIFKR